MPANSVSPIVRFGKFEVDQQTGELRKPSRSPVWRSRIDSIKLAIALEVDEKSGLGWLRKITNEML